MFAVHDEDFTLELDIQIRLLKRFWPPTTVVIVNQDELDRPQGGGKEVEYSTVTLYWVAIEFLKK